MFAKIKALIDTLWFLLLLISLPILFMIDLNSTVVVNTAIQSSFALAISELDVMHKDVLASQIVHETDAFRSKISIECNNFTGMKYTTNRHHAYGVCNGHAGYPVINGDRFSACLNDYAEWQHKYYRNYLKKYFPALLEEYLQTGVEPSRQIYYDFLTRAGYAEDRKYIDKVERWRKRLLIGGSVAYLNKRA